jgi:diguanylate cyclase (GGDEF)-like protein
MLKPEAALAAANAALEAGRLQEAREHAQAAVDGARGDLRLEAQALACLAHCDRIGSRLRRASTTARRAAQIFEHLGDAQGEAGALITLTHVSMLLGRNEEAVEAALLSVRLCDSTTLRSPADGDTPQPERPPNPQAVLAHNCLGLAFSWSGDHVRGAASLERAVDRARRCVPPVSVYQPRLNQVFVEASRLLDERYQTGQMGSLDHMEELLQECWQLEREGAGLSTLPGMRAMARVISLASTALLAAWQGRYDAAALAIESATRTLSGGMTWLDCFVRWCVAELSWKRGDWAAAQRELTEMKEMALAVEHEQLACRAQLLLAQVFELQGKHDEALAEHRALRLRERRVVADGMSSRESLVSWQLGARQSERHLQQALQASRQFERWSLEDALTGIANRRHFENVLAQKLSATLGAGRALTVAMVDVNKFKTVNDRFTHLVGDRVLKTIAAIMLAEVREQDLPVRWAGDEFVLLFNDTPEALARPVCERIQEAVAEFDWESVAPGLRVSVSIGLAEALPSDTAESVVLRADQSMYRAKPVPLATVARSRLARSARATMSVAPRNRDI